MVSEKITETFLKDFQCAAEKAFLDLDDEYPHPAHLPIGLLSRVENGHWETAYTRTLAYLLGNNNHGYGFAFLKALLKKIGSPTDFESCCVYAEKALSGEDAGRFDVYASGQVVIEAKTADYNIASVRKQLQKYDNELAAIEQKKIAKLFLTIYQEDEKNVSSSGWQNITWIDICDILWKVIKNKKNCAGYWYVKYFMVSIYADLYGYDAEFIDIYEFLPEAQVNKYARLAKNHQFDFELFRKYPTALLTLYDAIVDNYAEEKVFTQSYKNCVKILQQQIYDIFPAAAELNKPRSWNAWLKISDKDIEYNVGITNKMQKKSRHFKDGLYWFDNLCFIGKKRFENQQKWLNLTTKYFECDKYSNGFLGLSGTNTFLNVLAYDEKSAAEKISNDFQIIQKIAEKNNGL